MYPRLAPTSEWDTAAAHAIVEEAGGAVLQAGRCDNKGKPLQDWKVGCRAAAQLASWQEKTVRIAQLRVFIDVCGSTAAPRLS